MDMEIQFLHESFTEKDPKLLMDHIQKMASGEMPFFARTLSLVYDKLVEKAFPKPIPSGSGLGKPIEVPSVADPTPPHQELASTSSVPSISTSSNTPLPGPQPAPAPNPEPVSWNISTSSVWLQCNQCGVPAAKGALHDGVRCPECPPRINGRGRPYMECPLCNVVRVTPRETCVKILCQARFR